MTKIKICGLTQLKDILWVNDLKPDYVGFIFASSRRQLTPLMAADIARNINPEIKKVGVFVNPTRKEINNVISICPLDILQLHGQESHEFCNELKVPVWKSFRMQTKEILDRLKDYNVDAFLLDGYHPMISGGVGVSFPWEWARDLDTRGTPLVIAGGIDVDNVQRVISLLHPSVVDVSSSVEVDGLKDYRKIERFIRKVRDIDEKKY